MYTVYITAEYQQQQQHQHAEPIRTSKWANIKAEMQLLLLTQGEEKGSGGEAWGEAVGVAGGVAGREARGAEEVRGAGVWEGRE